MVVPLAPRNRGIGFVEICIPELSKVRVWPREVKVFARSDLTWCCLIRKVCLFQSNLKTRLCWSSAANEYGYSWLKEQKVSSFLARVDHLVSLARKVWFNRISRAMVSNGWYLAQLKLMGKQESLSYQQSNANRALVVYLFSCLTHLSMPTWSRLHYHINACWNKGFWSGRAQVSYYHGGYHCARKPDEKETRRGGRRRTLRAIF